MTAKKILFLYPNTTNRPIIPNAIAILAAIAKKMHWTVEYFDTYTYEKSPDSMCDREESGELKKGLGGVALSLKQADKLGIDLQHVIDTFDPDIIAATGISFEYEYLLSILSTVILPKDTCVAIGGIHATLEPRKVIESGLFDLVCIGEGEETFVELLTNYENGFGLSSIKNTYYLDKSSGEVVENERRNLLNENGLWKTSPDYSFFSPHYFNYPFDGKQYRRCSVEVARGCPYRCTYCGNSALIEVNKGLGRYRRARPVKSIKQHIEKLSMHVNPEMIYFQDECYFANSIDWLEDVAEWYGSEVRKPFIVQTRPESVTDEKIGILKRMNAPFFQVSMGVESGSERVLHDVCNRKVRVEAIVESFKLLHEHNVRSCAFFMIGFPTETREDIFKSIDLCRRIDPTVAMVSIFQPLPGQKLREVCIQEGYMTGDEPLKSFTEGSVLRMPQISSSEIANLRRCFLLYAMLDEKYYRDINKCERDYEGNRSLYQKLVNLRWELK